MRYLAISMFISIWQPIVSQSQMYVWQYDSLEGLNVKLTISDSAYFYELEKYNNIEGLYLSANNDDSLFFPKQ